MNRSAEEIVRHMMEHDRFSQWLGIEVLEVREGYSRIQMKLRAEMLNGFGIIHGGIAFSLADSAFAFACNSRNHNTVAAGCSIEFLRPAREGDVLTCEGIEQVHGGRHGIYDMRVRNQHGEAVALFRGKSAQIRGHVIDPEMAEQETRA